MSPDEAVSYGLVDKVQVPRRQATKEVAKKVVG
jgi:ATP-dependent protease ClpP protease subunit